MEKLTFTHNNQLITVRPIKGDANLYGVDVNSSFQGYIQKSAKEFRVLEGSLLSDELLMQSIDEIKKATIT